MKKIDVGKKLDPPIHKLYKLLPFNQAQFTTKKREKVKNKEKVNQPEN